MFILYKEESIGREKKVARSSIMSIMRMSDRVKKRRVKINTLQRLLLAFLAPSSSFSAAAVALV
jgi:hypothetical protein